MSIIPTYSNYDSYIADRKLYDNLLRYNPSVSNGNLVFASELEALTDTNPTKHAINTSVVGHTNDHVGLIEHVFIGKVQGYENDTLKQILYNDLANTNTFIENNVDREFNKLSSMRDKTYNAVYKTKQMYMLKKYEIAYNNFAKNVIQFSMFVAVVCALIMAAHYDPKVELNKKLAIAGVCIVLAVYLLILLLFVRKMMLRRKDDWNKFYFSSMDSKGSGSCSG